MEDRKERVALDGKRRCGLEEIGFVFLQESKFYRARVSDE